MQNWQEAAQQYQQAMQNADASGAINKALDAMDNQYDNGNNMPVFVAKEENATYQIRILPNFDTPYQWWLDAAIYDYHPPGLPAGFSPSVAGGMDPFDNWLRGTIPYDEDGKNPVQNAFKGCFSSKRALALVLVRTQHKDIDNSQIHVWSMPIKKGGFKHVIEPVIRHWGVHMMQQVDLYGGREATFMVVGKGLQRTLANFQWVGDPCMALEQNALAHIMETQYMPLHQTFRQLTEEDMQKYVEYYAPIAEAFLDNPQLAQSFVGPNARGARTPNARQMALQYLQQKSTTVPMGMAPPTSFGTVSQLPTAPAPPSGPAPSAAPPMPNVPNLPQGQPPAAPNPAAMPPMTVPAPAAPQQMPQMVPPPSAPPMAAPAPQAAPAAPHVQMTAPTGAPPAPPSAPPPAPAAAAPSGPPMPQPSMPQGAPPMMPPQPAPPPAVPPAPTQ